MRDHLSNNLNGLSGKSIFPDIFCDVYLHLMKTELANNYSQRTF